MSIKKNVYVKLERSFSITVASGFKRYGKNTEQNETRLFADHPVHLYHYRAPRLVCPDRQTNQHIDSSTTTAFSLKLYTYTHTNTLAKGVAQFR